MFERVDDLKNFINGCRPLDEDLMLLIQERLRLDWTYNSNALEGNTLTFGETAFFLREGLTSEGRPLKDYLEAKNHAEAIDWLEDILKDKRKFSEGLIKELHALLMRGIDFTYAKGARGQIVKKPLNIGRYKVRSNHVLTVSGQIHKYTDPLHVKDEMEKLVEWVNEEEGIHPVQKAAVLHYRFVAIHPFDDGNGRISRLLMNLILMKYSYPPCIVRNENRRQYLRALEIADLEGNLEVFLKFIESELYTTLVAMKNILEGKVKRTAIFEEKRVKLNRLEREKQILEVLRGAVLSVGQIKKKCPSIKRPTLKKDLQRLVANGIVEKKGAGSGVLYNLPPHLPPN